MADDGSNYDDDEVLTGYIWCNYVNLLTPDEWRVHLALVGDAKARHSSPTMGRFIKEKMGSIDDPNIAPMLADGEDAFLIRVRNRILTECSDKVFVNRCSQCERIVRTPLAQQCLWCGHDWHTQTEQ